MCGRLYYYTTARSNGWACLGCGNFLSLYPAINVRPVLGIPRFGQKFAVGKQVPTSLTQGGARLSHHPMSSEDTPKKANRCTQPTAQITAKPTDSCAPLDRPFVSMFGGLGKEGQLGPWLRAGAVSAWYGGVVRSEDRALFSAC